MNIWQRFTGFFKQRLTEYSFEIIPVWGGTQYSPTNYSSFAKNGFSRNELIYACIREIATSASEPELNVFEEDSDGELIEQNQHFLNKLLQNPNPLMSQTDFMESLLIYLKIAGDVFVEKERSTAGVILGLWPLRPDRVSISNDGNYEYQNGTKTRSISFDDMIHVKDFNPLNDWFGLSATSVAARAADVDNRATDMLNQFFNNAGVPYGLLKSKRKLIKTERERIQEQWGKNFGGANALKKIAVLDADADYQQLGINFRQMQFDSLDARSETRICMVYGVPPIIIAAKVGLDRSTFSNYREARQSFWLETLMPIYTKFSDAFTNQLAIPDFSDDFRIKFGLENVRALREDRNQSFERAERAMNGGFGTINDARREVGWEPMDDGDVLPNSIDKDRAHDFIQKADPYDSRWSLSQSKLIQLLKVDLKSEKQLDPDDPDFDDKINSEANFNTRVTEFWSEQQARLIEMLTGVEVDPDIVNDVFDEAEDALAQAALQPAVEQAVEQAVDNATIQIISLGVGFDEDLVNVAALDWAREHSVELAQGINDTTKKRVRSEITNWIADSENFDALVSRLDKIFNNKSRSELVASTEVTTAYAQGKLITWKESKVVTGKRWNTARDELVCPICRPLHRKVVPMADNFEVDDFDIDVEMPPAHPRCRCWGTPIVKGRRL